MNHIFKKTVGGVLKAPQLPVCLEAKCVYKMKISYDKVHQVNIESFLIEDTETLNINHYEGFYDKSYSGGEITVYKFPYTQEI